MELDKSFGPAIIISAIILGIWNEKEVRPRGAIVKFLRKPFFMSNFLKFLFQNRGRAPPPHPAKMEVLF